MASSDLYLGVSGSQASTIATFLPLVGHELAPAIEVLGAKGNAHHPSGRCRLFLKVGGAGGASVHARSPCWWAADAVAGSFGATDLTGELRRLFMDPPDVFSVGHVGGERYASGYYFWPKLAPR